MQEDVKRIYEAFGFDTSKPLRKLTDITDEEAKIIGRLFDDKLSPWTIERKSIEEYLQRGNKEIVLTSTPHKFGEIIIEGELREGFDITKLILYLNGEIEGPNFANQKKYELINQYLFSIGVEREILSKERLEKLLSNQ